jgi:osmotically-inducible protein OsmY
MKKLTLGAAAVAASLLLAAPFAQAQSDDTPAPKFESPADVALQDTVKHALDADKRLRGALLTVAVYEGRVQVNGLTEDYTQNAEVERVARQAAPGHQVLTFLDELIGD